MLRAAKENDPDAVAALYRHLYRDLKRVAHGQLGRAHQATLNTTAVVHEAYLRLFGTATPRAGDREHFMALAASVMRNVIVDYVRQRRALKRGGDLVRATLDPARIPIADDDGTVLAIDEALTRLADVDDRLSKVVELRFFAGMTEEEIGTALGVTSRTVRNDWRKARAWLAVELA
jgi:RNA polymerase sigma factor (TIGR02999 family)